MRSILNLFYQRPTLKDAIINDEPDLVEIFLLSGVDVNAPIDGITPMELAIKLDKMAMFNALRTQGAHVRCPINLAFCTILHDRPTFITPLHQLGADLNSNIDMRKLMYTWVSGLGHLRPRQFRQTAVPPIYIAALLMRADCIKALVTFNTPVNFVDCYGNTLLHAVALHAAFHVKQQTQGIDFSIHEDLINTLTKAGIDSSTKNEDNKTAAEIWSR